MSNRPYPSYLPPVNQASSKQRKLKSNNHIYINYFTNHNAKINLMSKGRTHNYPETRKPRDTSYSEKYRITKKHGLNHIQEVWEEKGMYRASKVLETSPYVIRDIAQSENWQRDARKAPIILAGVKAGKMPPEHYKTLDFSTINLNEKEESNE